MTRESRGKFSTRVLIFVIILSAFSTISTSITFASEPSRNFDCNTGIQVEDGFAEPTFTISYEEDTSTVSSGEDCIGKVVLPDGVDVIGLEAFQGSELTEIILPNSLLEIGIRAFKNSSLEKIILPTTLNSIRNRAFQSTKITEINIPGSVISIEEGAFQNNSFLEKLTLNEGTKNIDYQAFRGTVIKELDLPNSMESVESEAFYLVSDLIKVNLGSNLKLIGSYSFYGVSITSLVIPQSVESIGASAFQATSDLITLSVTDSVTSFGSLAFVDSGVSNGTIKYCGSALRDSGGYFSSGYFVSSTFICERPSPPSITAFSAAYRSITLTLGAAIDHGGAPISGIDIDDSEGNQIQRSEFASSRVLVLTNQPLGKNLTFRVRAQSSEGYSNYSNFTIAIKFQTTEQESEQARRQALLKKELEIARARESSLSKLRAGEVLTLEDFNKSGFNLVTSDNLALIQKRLSTTLDLNNPQIKDIDISINYVVTLDRISNLESNRTPMYAQTLVDVGLISSSNKSKTYIWYLIKKAPASERRDEESVIALIGEFQRQIENRKNRLVELKARVAARQSQI